MRPFLYLLIFFPLNAMAQYPVRVTPGILNMGVMYNEQREGNGIIDTLRISFKNDSGERIEFYPEAARSYPDLVNYPKEIRGNQTYVFEFLIHGSYGDSGGIIPVYRQVHLPTKEGINLEMEYQYVLVHADTKRIYEENRLSEIQGLDDKGFPVVLKLDSLSMPASLGSICGNGEKRFGHWVTWKDAKSPPIHQDYPAFVYVETAWTHMDSLVFTEREDWRGVMRTDVSYKTWPVTELDSVVYYIDEKPFRSIVEKHATKENLFRIAAPQEATRMKLFKGKYNENLRLHLRQYQGNNPYQIQFSKKKEERLAMGSTDLRYRYDFPRYNLVFNYEEESFKKYPDVEAYRQYLIKKYPKLYFNVDNIADLTSFSEAERKTALARLQKEPGIYSISRCVIGVGNSAFTYAAKNIYVYMKPGLSPEAMNELALKYGFDQVARVSYMSDAIELRYAGKLLDEEFYRQVNAMTKDKNVMGVEVFFNFEVELD